MGKIKENARGEFEIFLMGIKISKIFCFGLKSKIFLLQAKNQLKTLPRSFGLKTWPQSCFLVKSSKFPLILKINLKIVFFDQKLGKYINFVAYQVKKINSNEISPLGDSG